MFNALMSSDEGFLTVDELVGVIGRSRNTTYQRVRELEEMDLIVREWRGDQLVPRFYPSDWAKSYRAAFRTVAAFERNLRFGPHRYIVEDADHRILHRGDDLDDAVLFQMKAAGSASVLERKDAQ